MYKNYRECSQIEYRICRFRIDLTHNLYGKKVGLIYYTPPQRAHNIFLYHLTQKCIKIKTANQLSNYLNQKKFKIVERLPRYLLNNTNLSI